MVITASGNEHSPALIRNSKTQSADPESDRFGSTTGYNFLMSSKCLLSITPSRAVMKFTLPRTVLISPLCANTLKERRRIIHSLITINVNQGHLRPGELNSYNIYLRGCALSQLGKVFVENLVWTSARYVS